MYLKLNICRSPANNTKDIASEICMKISLQEKWVLIGVDD